MTASRRLPMSPPLDHAYSELSTQARALMWGIMHGSHTGAHPVTGTEAEQDAIDAKCIVTDGQHIWVAQEAARLVGHGPDPRMPTTWAEYFPAHRAAVTAELEASAAFERARKRMLTARARRMAVQDWADEEDMTNPYTGVGPS